MKQNFHKSLALTLGHEGGYSNHPKDPGGSTNFGITQKTYSAFRKGRKLALQSVKFIDPAEVKTIYLTHYWNVIRGDLLPIGLDYVTFDASVNSGTGRGPKWTQRALSVTADGMVGSKTAKAAYAAYDKGEMVAVIKKAVAYRLGFLKGLSHWSTFGRGWSRRVAEVEAGGIGMVAGSSQLRVEAELSTKKVRSEAVTSVGGAGGGSIALTQAPEWVAVLGFVALAVFAIIVAKRVIASYDRAQMMNKVADLLDKEDE